MRYFKTTCPNCGHYYKTKPKARLHSRLVCRICGTEFVRSHPRQVLCGRSECKRENTRRNYHRWAAERRMEAK